jgi:hypothetical protein
MPQPVFQHRLIVVLTACPPDDDDTVDYPCQTADTQQKAGIPEGWPGCAEKRGDEERGAKMHDVWRGECPGCLSLDAIKVTTTNINPVSAADAEPTMT